MTRVLLYAIPFGQGPLAKAVVIAKRLQHTHHVTVASFGRGLEYIAKSLPNCATLDTGNRELTAMRGVLGRINVFVSLMDLRVAAAVKKECPAIKTVFVDSLLSWRLREYSSEALSDLDCIDLYVAQYVPGVTSAALTAKLGNNAAKVNVVAPLVDRGTECEAAPRDTVVVHFGGLDSPVMPHSDYLPFVRQTVVAVLEAVAAERRVVFISCRLVVESVGPSVGPCANASFASLPYEQCQNLLASAAVIVTTPGIETVYEGVQYGTPVVLLPPLNSTQLHQLRQFRAAGFPNLVTSGAWKEFERIEGLALRYPEKSRQMCRMVNAMACDPRYTMKTQQTIRRIVFSQTTMSKVRDTQQRYVPAQLRDGLKLIEEFVGKVATVVS